MAKTIDDSGFWIIKNNPISKEGVFPYLGENISPDLEPKKIYMVYRPVNELNREETIESFDGVPFIDNHEMIGEGFTPYDERPAGGVLMNPRVDDGVMYGDFRIFSEDLKDKIVNGKKELSLGYLCNYEIRKGVWNGQTYDAIQTNLRGNHIALVENARMGHDCKVYDNKTFATDSIDFESKEENVDWVGKEIPDGQDTPEKDGEKSPLTTQDEGDKMADKREAIRKVMAIAAKPNSDFEGGEEEKVETIAKILEASEYAKSEAGTANDESEKDEDKKTTEDKCGKDEDEEKEDKKTEDEDETKSDDKETEDEDDEDEKDDKKSVEDSANLVLREIEARSSLKASLTPLVGEFACDGMTSEEIAVYGCKKLGLQVAADEAKSVLKGFLAAQDGKNETMYGFRRSDASVGMDKALQEYLK